VSEAVNIQLLCVEQALRRQMHSSIPHQLLPAGIFGYDMSYYWRGWEDYAHGGQSGFYYDTRIALTSCQLAYLDSHEYKIDVPYYGCATNIQQVLQSLVNLTILREWPSLWTYLAGKVTLSDTVKKEYHKSRQVDKCKGKNMQEKKQRQTKVEWLHRLFSEAQWRLYS